MFWRGEGKEPRAPEGGETGGGVGGSPGPIRVTPDAPRPATILRVAGELEQRGGRILELFKEIRSPLGQVVFPIHLLKDEETYFVEVATGPWDERSEREVAWRAAVLRNSEHTDAQLELLSAYPVPDGLRFLCGRSPAALLQLDLLNLRADRPEEAAAVFREVAGRHWGVDLDFEPGYLPLVEDLLMAALDGEEAGGSTPPVSDGLVAGLGGYLGETIRRNAGHGAAWSRGAASEEGPGVEVRDYVLDPVGKARAFLREGAEESMAFYANYVLELLEKDRTSGTPGPQE